MSENIAKLPVGEPDVDLTRPPRGRMPSQVKPLGAPAAGEDRRPGESCVPASGVGAGGTA